MKEVSKVILINKETNKHIRKYAYEDLSLDIKLREELNNYVKTGKYKLICCCSTQHELEFKIENSTSLKVIPAHKNMGDLHDKCCCKSDEFKKFKSKFISGINKREDSDEVDITLKFKPKLKPEYNTLDTEPIKKNKLIYLDGYKINKISTLSLTTHLNLMTQERFYKFNYENINNREEFLSKTYGTANKMNINGKNLKLQEIMYDPKKDDDLLYPEYRYIYGYINQITDYGKKLLLKIIYKYFKGNEFTTCIYVDREMFLNAMNYPKVKDIKNKLKYFAIGGFISRKEKGKIPEFLDLAIINIANNGLFCESSYEIRFYNFLIKNNIGFYKPYEPLIEYDGHIPDGIINNPTTGKTTFIEIFGFDSNEYRANMEHKIMIMENLKETHNLLKWNALDGEVSPTIDDINKIIHT